MKTKKWIQKANLKKGAFTKQAKAHGKSVQGFAHEVINNPSKFSARTKRRAHLAITFHKMAT